MDGFGVLFVLFVLLALAAPLVLYALVRSETSDRETMDRSEAQARAREEYERARDRRD
jgi:hypothetical protein